MKRALLIVTLIFSYIFSNNLVIYNNNLASISSTATFMVKKGVNKLEFPNFPNTIITDSILADFSSNIELLEQVFKSNRTDFNNILRLNLNQDLLFYPINNLSKTLEGKLINIKPITIISNNRYYILDSPLQIIYKNYPQNSNSALISWKVIAKKDAKERVKIDYLARGFNWYVNYILKLQDKRLNLRALATIENSSGKDFKDANISLIAGKLNSIMPAQPRAVRTLYSKTPSLKDTAPKKIDGYYKYEILFKTDIFNNQTKQITIIDKKDIPYKSYSLAYNSNFNNYGIRKLNFTKHIEFINNKKSNLYLPLPYGKVRVYKNSIYLGQSYIQNTTKDEKIDIAIGDLFDVVGEKKILKYISKDNYKFIKTQYTIKNRSKKLQILKIKEQIPRYGNNIKKQTNCKDICIKKEESAFINLYTIKLKPNSNYTFTSSFEISY